MSQKKSGVVEETSFDDGEEIKSNDFCGGPVPYMQIAGKDIFGANDKD
jgi:hypothetical protein